MVFRYYFSVQKFELTKDKILIVSEVNIIRPKNMPMSQF